MSSTNPLAQCRAWLTSQEALERKATLLPWQFRNDPRLLALARAAVEMVENCPTCGGSEQLLIESELEPGLLGYIPCPTCTPLRTNLENLIKP